MAVTEQRPRHRMGPAPGAAFRVAWVGERPWWLDDPAARAELDDVEPGGPEQPVAGTVVVHARAAALHTLRGRRSTGERVVADLSGAERLGRREARAARSADLVLVDDERRLRMLGRDLRKPWALVRTPVDLVEHAPERMLRQWRDSEVKRFRRLHRLSNRTLLYAGPYCSEGGLHVLLDLAQALRERYDDVVVAAIPEGEVDARYRDACERRALALGHRAIVQWTVDDATRPLWYALANLVCLPATAPVDVRPALYAAAAGVPFVAGAVTPFAERPPELAGELVPPGDAGALAARIELLLAKPARARAAGNAARCAAEAQLSPAAAARRLRTLWSDLAARA
jgi:glycosyltransferase involved in cell wall biosynthesis